MRAPQPAARACAGLVRIIWPMLRKIVSGGQTGVDRGALDAALEAGFPCGGWCPKGRKAEDGGIPDRYPLTELPGADYRQRTRQNVVDSDGTLVVCLGEPSGGTLETVRFARHLGKPLLVVVGAQTVAPALARRAADFVAANSIAVLNVAGPRESGWPGARACAQQVVSGLIEATRRDS